MSNYCPTYERGTIVRPSWFRVLTYINPLNAELNPICHLLALFGARRIFHVSDVRVNTDMRHLTTGIRSEECVDRQFRRCANVYLTQTVQYSLLHT